MSEICPFDELINFEQEQEFAIYWTEYLTCISSVILVIRFYLFYFIFIKNLMSEARHYCINSFIASFGVYFVFPIAFQSDSILCVPSLYLIFKQHLRFTFRSFYSS